MSYRIYKPYKIDHYGQECHIEFRNHIKLIIMARFIFELFSLRLCCHLIDICCFSAKYSTLRSKSKDLSLRIRIMCPSRVTRLPADYDFNELVPIKILIRPKKKYMCV